jgi:hypothetical protein
VSKDATSILPTTLEEEVFSTFRVLERLGQPLGSAHTSQQKMPARTSRRAEVVHKALHILASALSPLSSTTPSMIPLNTATDVKRPRQNIHKAKPAPLYLRR